MLPHRDRVQLESAYLPESQQPDGAWNEDLATGTGFPNVFFLSYHLYRHYFPLLALATMRPGNAP
jgi:squalene-hopene/tetraprenyl-beta-curcumene cyclase